MNGATAVPCVKTNNPPKIRSANKIGINQNFFLVNINLQISFKKSIRINYTK